jgi:CRISPR-associated protein Csb2
VPTLRLRFPAGRYHATPWGHHVNEGLIEWPPSPWRLLRALIACGFSTQRWNEVPLLAQQLINKLAEILPSYRLPETCLAHSRHFMPLGSLSKGREQTTLVFDTWADVGDGEAFIHWGCDLNDEETGLLRQLAASLGYLGRSESWVEAELAAEAEVSTTWPNAIPHRDGLHPGPKWEQVSLMAAIPSGQYAAWHRKTTEPILELLKPPANSRKPTAKQLEKLRAQREQSVAPYPPDLLSCLMRDTAWWKQQGWSQPPGSRRVLYWRRADSLEVGVPQLTKPQHVRPVTTMLLALTTSSGSLSSLPPRVRTLPQAELFHRALVGRVGNGHRVQCPELTGKDERGRRLQDHHEHAHTLPVDLDGDGRLDHLIVYAKMGLGGDAQRAIRTLRRTWAKGVAGEIQLAVVGYGALDTLRKLPPPLRFHVDQILGPDGGTRFWESSTPFVPPRFLKPRGNNTLSGQVNAELASRRLPEAERVDVCPDLTRRLRHHIRRRKHGGLPPPIDMGYGLRLTFSKPIQGPLMLGYGSHYGLGMFSALAEGDAHADMG